MARSDLLKDLLRSYQRGDDRAFRSAADAIVEDERKKRHEILADELEAIINGAPPRRARPSNISSLRPLPKAREDVPLLDTWQSGTSLQDVVLQTETEELVLDLVDEFRQRSALAAHGLKPRGHRSATVTLNTYTHLFEGDLAGVMDRLDDRLRDETRPERVLGEVRQLRPH